MSRLKIWIYAKLDKIGIKVVKGFDHDPLDTSWAKDFTPKRIN